MGQIKGCPVESTLKPLGRPWGWRGKKIVSGKNEDDSQSFPGKLFACRSAHWCRSYQGNKRRVAGGRGLKGDRVILGLAPVFLLRLTCGLGQNLGNCLGYPPGVCAKGRVATLGAMGPRRAKGQFSLGVCLGARCALRSALSEKPHGSKNVAPPPRVVTHVAISRAGERWGSYGQKRG